MGKKSSAKKNGFFYFMLEIQRQEQEKGVRCTIAAATPIAADRWKDMSEAEKQHYNDMAKNATDKNNPAKKFTALGVSFECVDRQERAKVESLNVMSSNIKSCVEKLHRTNQLKSHVFFVIHVNFYFKTDDNYYAPAEVALVAFNFERGRIDTLHFFVKIGEIPLGLLYNVKERSTNTHKIKFDSSWKDPLSNYREMYNRVFNFIKKYSPNEHPTVYTMCDSLNHNYSDSAVRCAIENMCDAARVDSSIIRVYHLDKLFHEIITVLRPADFFSTALMRAELEKDAFSYAQNQGCYYHEEEADCSLNCSLSIAVRWIYTMCDHCCKCLNIQLALGYHVPAEVDVHWKKGPSGSEHDSIESSMRNLSFVEQTRKDTRMDRPRMQEQAGESVCFPKPGTSKKIGARFDSAVSSSGANSTTDDDDWSVVETGRRYGLGRGKIISNQAQANHHLLPTSGRGRLASMKEK